MEDQQMVGTSRVHVEGPQVAADGDVHAAEGFPRSSDQTFGSANISRNGVLCKRIRLPGSKSIEDSEDVCFVCFAGGPLLLCDHKGCPKAYHLACIGQDETSFRHTSSWNCSLHICSNCEKTAEFMCYTCTYSLCMSCIEGAESTYFFCVKGNGGFCSPCMDMIMLIENDEKRSKEEAVVNFDDKCTWANYFENYWINLNVKLSITKDELKQAKSSPKGFNFLANKESAADDVTNVTASKKGLQLFSKDASCKEQRIATADEISLSNASDWASKELLEFVAYMRNGNTSFLSQLDVRGVLLEYIKRNNLRDPCRKSQITCDARLKNLFGKAQVRHFEMLKLLDSHLFIKEYDQIVNVKSRVEDAHVCKVEAEGRSKSPTNAIKDESHGTHKVEKGALVSRTDNFAAVVVHNASLLYLERSLIENLIQYTRKLGDKSLGVAVRIKELDSGQTQEMFGLVQVFGVKKVEESSRPAKMPIDGMLEDMKLHKDVIPIYVVSNQSFSEDEHEQLQKKIKSWIHRRTTEGVKENAMMLPLVIINDERQEKHATPIMDQSCDTDKNEARLDDESEENLENSRPSTKRRKLVSPGKVSPKNVNYHEGQKRSTAASGQKEEISGNVAIVKERDDCISCSPQKHKNQVLTSCVEPYVGNPNVMVRSAPSSETPQLSLAGGLAQFSNDFETDKMWHYQDPSGQIRGPFSMLQLHRWSTSSHFPSNMVIWKTKEKQEDSIMLIDALMGNFHRPAQMVGNGNLHLRDSVMVD